MTAPFLFDKNGRMVFTEVFPFSAFLMLMI